MNLCLAPGHHHVVADTQSRLAGSYDLTQPSQYDSFINDSFLTTEVQPSVLRLIKDWPGVDDYDTAQQAKELLQQVRKPKSFEDVDRIDNEWKMVDAIIYRRLFMQDEPS